MPRIDPEKLKKLLGQILLYQGRTCQVIEILSEEPAVVLRDHQGRKVLQTNQYGNASGWAPQTLTVSLLDARRDRLNPDLPELATLDLLA